MVSYAHPLQIAEAAEICQSIAIDNGAFSAWRADEDYNFAGYLDFCEKWRAHPAVDFCVIPDVIDGTEEENDKLINDWPWQDYSAPVWHMNESMQRLENLCEAFPRVCLGSSGQYAQIATPQWWARMAEAMQHACDKDGTPDTKLHGLRMLDPVLFAHIPFSSADSCNVARNVGIDSRWLGPYAPTSRAARAAIMIDRIEMHASAARWSGESSGVQQNLELFG
jgi:hypothetical protein